MTAPILTEADLIDHADQSVVDPRKKGATPDHPAYMIYTSGSTGTPKGIVITGRNICHYLRSANETYRIDKSDVVFQGASIAFDLSMEEIWIPYLAGATLFVATPEVMGEAEALPDLMEEVGVTVLDTVPTLLVADAARHKNLAHHHPRRRSLPAGGGQSLVQAGAAHLQLLRPDRSDGRRHSGGSAAQHAGDHWRPHRQLHLLCRRRGQ